MDFISLFVYVIAFTYIGVTIYLANQHDTHRNLKTKTSSLQLRAQPVEEYLQTEAMHRQESIVRWLLYGVAGITFLIPLYVLQMAFLSNLPTELMNPDTPLPEIDQKFAIINFVLGLGLTLVSFSVIRSESTRQLIKRLIGKRGFYDPNSLLHTTAVVLCLFILSMKSGEFVFIGGTTGLAEEFAANNPTSGSVLFEMILFVIVSFLGVGLAIRRSPLQSLDRLGLRLPTYSDIGWGVGVGVILLGVVFVVALLWTALTPESIIEEQTAAAEQIAQAFGTLPLAFIVSISAALGEEIMFRGALQPVFGIVPTSIFFALLHTQYSLTPATLIIVIVAFGLGLLRKRQSTSSAIIAHFVYNFLQLSLAILSSDFRSL